MYASRHFLSVVPKSYVFVPDGVRLEPISATKSMLSVFASPNVIKSPLTVRLALNVTFCEASIVIAVAVELSTMPGVDESSIGTSVSAIFS